MKCAKKGFINTATDQIECVSCRIPIKLAGVFTDRLSEAQSIIIAKFQEDMKKSHKENCPFVGMEVKQKLVLRVKPLLHEYQVDYTDFTRASFYLNWEANLHENRDSLVGKEVPVVDSEWVDKTLKAETLELLWMNSAVTRKEREFDAINVIALYGWKCEIVKDIPTLICKYCLRRTCTSIYLVGQPIQSIEEKVDAGTKYLFNPERAHYTYCKWVRKTKGKMNGPELSLELLKARLDLATKAVNTSRILAGVYSDPQAYLEDRLKVANHVKQIYSENELLGTGNKSPLTIRQATKKLRDVDTIETSGFLQYIEKKLTKALDKNKEIKDKTEEIKSIVAGKRKQLDDLLETVVRKKAKLDDDQPPKEDEKEPEKEDNAKQ